MQGQQGQFQHLPTAALIERPVTHTGTACVRVMATVWFSLPSQSSSGCEFNFFKPCPQHSGNQIPPTQAVWGRRRCGGVDARGVDPYGCTPGRRAPGARACQRKASVSSQMQGQMPKYPSGFSGHPV